MKRFILSVIASMQFLCAFGQWNPQTSGTSNDLWSIYFTSSSTGFMVGDVGTIRKTTNGGTNWNTQTSGTSNPLISVYFTDLNNGYAVGYSGTILKTIDAGANWTTETSGTGNFLRSVYFTIATTGYAVGQSGTILKTVDAGLTWTAQTSGTSNDLYSIYFTDANTGYAVGSSGTIRKTTDAGATWAAQTSGTSDHLHSVYFTNTNTGYAVGENGAIRKTTDAGANWTGQGSGTNNKLWSTYFINTNTGYAVGFGGTIIKTVNGGSTWLMQSSGTSVELYCVRFSDTNTGYISGLTGVIRKNACATLDAGIGSSDVSCFGGNNGSITSTPTGGVPAYTYLWNPGGLTTAAISNLSAGTYTLTVSDNNSCAHTVLPSVKQPTLLSTTVTPVNVSCAGGFNGSTSIAASGGTPAYSYSWNTGATTQTATGLSAGTYSINTTDANGCINTRTVSITQPSTVTVSISGNTSICAGQSTSLTHSAAGGGTGGFTYSWSPGGATTTFITASPTITSNYTVVATDANSCTGIAIKTVTVTSTASAPTTGSDSPRCSGTTLNLTASTITGATYSWTGPNSFTSATKNPSIGSVNTIAAGTYSVITSVTGCVPSAAATVSVVVNQTPTAPAGGSNSTVNSGQTLSLTASTVSGATYNWNGPNSFSSSLQNPTIANITIPYSGNYTVKSVANGCNSTNVNVLVVVNNTNAVTVSVTPTPATCASTDGTATATLSGGTAPYTYVWDSNAANQTTQTATGLTAGIYSVTVTDVTSSQASGSVIVNNTGMSVSASSPTTLCSGQSATLNATPSGGSAPYTYSWAPDDGTFDNINISNPVASWFPPSGDYVVTVTEAGGCIALSTVKITREPLTLGFGVNSNSPVCAGQTLSLNADAVTGATYSWSGPNGFTATGQNPTIPAASTAATGSYSITTTAVGCVLSGATGTIGTYSVNPLPSANAGADQTICSGQSATLNASGGTTYSWSPGGQTTISVTVSPTISTNYTLTATNPGGCSSTDVAMVDMAPPSVGGTAVGTLTVCAGSNSGVVTLTGHTGTVANWEYSTNGGSTWTNIANTTSTNNYLNITQTTGYRAVVQNGSCPTSNSSSVTITVNATPTVSISGSATVCAGNTTTLTASGATTYSWNTSETTTSISVSPTINTTYTVTGTSSGCSNTTTVVVTAIPSPSVSISGNNTICAGSAATLTASGGTTYSWSTTETTASITVSPTINTSYTVTGTTSGCSNTSTSVVTANALPSVSISGNNTICPGGLATLTASGGTTYSWSTTETTASITVSPTINTSYTVTGTTSGCSATATSVVTLNSTPAVSISGNSTVCAGNSTTLTASGATSYNWSGGVINGVGFIPGATTTYTVVGTNSGGCSDTAIVLVTVNPLPSVAVSGSSTVCNGFSTALSATGGSMYSWNTGDITAIISVSPTTATTYTVTGTDALGCSASATISVSNPLPIPITATVTPTSCGLQSGTASVSVSGAGAVPPFSYLWNTGSTSNSITGLDAGIYRANVTDGNGCFSFADALITSTNGPAVTTNSVTAISCFGMSTGAIDMNVTGGTPPYTFFWSNGVTTEDVNNLSYGPYEIVVTDGSGCSVTKSVFVSEPAALSVSSFVINSSCGASNGSASVSVSGGNVPYNYAWSSGASSSAVAGISAGVYTVSITDSKGCFDSLFIAVMDSAGPAVIIDTVAAADCGSQGFILIVPQDPALIASYFWTNGSTTQNLSNAVPGNYGLVITDTSGCIATLVVPVKPVLPALKPICLTTVDTITGKNIIVWEKPPSLVVAGFNIYRESSQNGIYQLIAYQPYNLLTTYYDSSAKPSDKWSKYRISMTDICGKEGPKSPEHKTIHLSIQSSSASTTTLIWDAYVGYTFSGYNVFRKDSLNGYWNLIGTTPSVTTTYTDAGFPHTGGKIYYHVDVDHPGGDCIATIKDPMGPLATTVKSGKSNSSDRITLPGSAVNELPSYNWLSIYPNPSSGNFMLESSRSAILNIHIYNMLGDEVYQKEVAAQKADISIPGIANGVYQLQVVTTSGIFNRKIVISR